MKVGKIFIAAVALLLFVGLITSLAFAEDISDKRKEVDKIFPEAMKLIDEGNLDEGLELLKKVTVIAPERPDMHMNYGSILFIKGEKVFQSGEKEKGMMIFKEAENELLSAIKLFKERPSAKDNSAIPIAQCNFLLGDIYFYEYGDKKQAKSFYQEALEYYPDHGGAKEALKDLE